MAKILPKFIGFFVVVGLLSFGFNQVFPDPVPGADTFSDEEVADQRAALALASVGAGPQAPRDIESSAGTNSVTFAVAPDYTEMNLCNIHFHEGAEHKGGEYTTYDGNGDGTGYGTGYIYNGSLSAAELADYDNPVGSTIHGDLVPGDTIEIHYVHTTDTITPGPTLGSCLSGETEGQPQLQVQAQVYVLVNDSNAADLTELTEISNASGVHQANIPTNLGTIIQYAGSTTGPSYNEAPSPLLVTWNVHPNVLKVDIASVEAWFQGNVFEEDYAHAVRNLVINPAHLSPIS